MWSASDKMREAKKEYMDVVRRREFMEAQMALSAAGRAQLARIREARGEDPLTGKKIKKKASTKGERDREADEEAKGAVLMGDRATAALGILAGAAAL